MKSFLFFLFFVNSIFASIEMEFVVDNFYVIGHMLHWEESKRFSSKKNRKDIFAFQREVWWKTGGQYPLLPYFDIPALYHEESLQPFMQWAETLSSFQKIQEEMVIYKADVEKKWASDYKRTSRYIQEVTGLALEGKYEVYLSHQSQINGRYLGKHIITWGSSGSFGHYDVIYLWHEILHSLLPKDDLAHCIIQLIADNGLRIFLNVQERGTAIIGYPAFMPLMERLAPKWEEYLKREEKDIFSFLEEMKIYLNCPLDEGEAGFFP